VKDGGKEEEVEVGTSQEQLECKVKTYCIALNIIRKLKRVFTTSQ
jgi:hypothetical protein